MPNTTATSNTPTASKAGEDKIDEYLACIPRILSRLERMNAELAAKNSKVPLLSANDALEGTL